MGQTDDIMMKARPSGYMYTPITRGHKPTPSQESNTLSEVSCTTTVSMDSGPISPTTYREEEEESRLEDFRDESDREEDPDHISTCSEHNVTLTPDQTYARREPPLPELRTRSETDTEFYRRLGTEPPSAAPSQPELRLSNSNLSTRSSTVSGGFRDSCDTVVRVCVTPCGTGCVNHAHNNNNNKGETRTSLSNGMSRDTKSANSDYGSFCATPPSGEVGAGPPKGGVPGQATYRVESGSTDHIDNSIISGELYQRAPLLTDSDPDDDPAPPGGAAPTGRAGDRAAPVKLTVPGGESARSAASLVPSEPLKTLLAGLFLGSGFVATSTSLAVTHDSVPDTEPLPDIILDNVSYQQWGLDVSEYLIMISTFSAFLVVLLHYHRFIILRRVWFMLGCLYYYRAITMFVTVLPKADPSYTCHPKLDNTTILPGIVIVKRVLILMSGMGLSINGKHIYCGDYIFSGHTMVLTMGYLVIKEYSPRRFFVLHWASFLVSLTGIIMLLIARGHYTIDCLLAYYVTTRLWWIYHTLAHNSNLKTRGSHNFLDQMWWWLIFRYFEKSIDGPLPRKYSLPLPRRLKKYIKARRAQQSSDAEAQP